MNCRWDEQNVAHALVRAASRLVSTLAILLTSLPAAAQYANPKLCAACHPAIAKTWHQNGMGRSFAAPRPDLLIEDFTKDNSYHHPASDTFYQMLNRDGVLVQRRYQRGFEGKETNDDLRPPPDRLRLHVLPQRVSRHSFWTRSPRRSSRVFG